MSNLGRTTELMQVGRASEKTGWKCLVVESKAAQAYLQEHDRLRSTCAPSHLDAARILTRFGFLTLYRDSTVQDPRAPGLGHPPVSQKRGSWLWEHPSSHARHTQHELLGVLPARHPGFSHSYPVAIHSHGFLRKHRQPPQPLVPPAVLSPISMPERCCSRSLC